MVIYLPKKFSLGNVAEGILRVGAVAGGTGSQQIGRSDLWFRLLNVNIYDPIGAVVQPSCFPRDLFTITCQRSAALFVLKTAFYSKV